MTALSSISGTAIYQPEQRRQHGLVHKLLWSDAKIGIPIFSRSSVCDSAGLAKQVTASCNQGWVFYPTHPLVRIFPSFLHHHHCTLRKIRFSRQQNYKDTRSISSVSSRIKMPEITQPLPTQQMTAPGANGAGQGIDQQPVSHWLSLE